MNRYTISKKGQVNNPGRCGRLGNALINYHILITLRELPLGDHGLVFEHEDLVNIAQQAISGNYSCEQAAQALIARLSGWLGEQQLLEKPLPAVTAIEVTLGLDQGSAQFTIIHYPFH
jgi:hypothetical protein